MFSHEIYKSLHFLGIFLVFAGLGGACVRGLTGSDEGRRLVAISHGVGLLAILVSGFGMLARMGVGGAPGWALAKIGIWALLGGLIALAAKRAQWARMVWFRAPLLGLGAVWLVLNKPF